MANAISLIIKNGFGFFNKDWILKVRDWSEIKVDDSKLERYGGIQVCPWCRQTAQHGSEWSFKEYDKDPFLDVLTCGNCKGTSLWRFEVGMIFIGVLKHPIPKAEETAFDYWGSDLQGYDREDTVPHCFKKEQD